MAEVKHFDIDGTVIDIPVVNNATLTIQKNGTNVQTFTANSSTNKTANITVPTKVSELTNDSGYTTNTGTVTQVKVGSTAYDPSSGVVSLPAYPTVNNATLTIQKNGTNVQTFTANQGTNATANITMSKSDVGLGNVGNFKAVSTVASQGLTDTEKSNARANIGAGTSSFSGSYNDLTNKPTIPTVNDATLTIQKNGTNVQTFTANASANKTANITVPTKVSELTNDSGYTTNTGTVTQVKVGSTAYDPSSGIVSLPAYPTVNNATLTIQKNGNTVKTFTANASSAVTANITVPTKTSDLTNDSGYTTNTGTVTQVKVGSTAYDPSSGVVSLPAYPTVNNATLTIQKNGTNVQTFTANSSSNKTANITVPTKVSELTNDSGYTTNTGTVTQVKVGSTAYDPSSGVVSLPAYPTVPTVNNATLTIQKNGTNVQTFTANSSSNKTANITVPTKVSELTNDSGYTTNTGTVTQVKVGSTAYNPSSGVVSLPAYPTVNNATLTIQKNGTNVQTFTANSSTNKTANITVPTKTSELTNDDAWTLIATSTGNNVTFTKLTPSTYHDLLIEFHVVNNSDVEVMCTATVPINSITGTNDGRVRNVRAGYYGGTYAYALMQAALSATSFHFNYLEFNETVKTKTAYLYGRR